MCVFDSVALLNLSQRQRKGLAVTGETRPFLRDRCFHVRGVEIESVNFGRCLITVSLTRRLCS